MSLRGGDGCKFIVQHYPSIIRENLFIIDTYKTGTIAGVPIISFEDFRRKKDCIYYTVIITSQSFRAQKEIAENLDKYHIKHMSMYSEKQYFDLPELNLGEEYFADVGALDGATTKQFFACVPKGHAYVLEPNPEQSDVLKHTLATYPNAEIFPFGAYSENTTLFFDNSKDSAGAAISKDGTVAVEVRKLDDLLKGKKLTFIKMDIEGSELEALKGAEQIIREQKPKLAICVYHKPEDIWEVPSLILSYRPDYKLYLRHYSFVGVETVLYAV